MRPRAARGLAVPALLATVLAACVAAPAPSRSTGSPIPSGIAASPRLPAASHAGSSATPPSSDRPSAVPSATDPGQPVPVRALPGAPTVAFATMPEPGRLVVEIERPGEPPRVLTEIAVDPAVPRARVTALASPDARWVGVVTTLDDTSGELALYTASGEKAWAAARPFGIFMWAADSSVVAVDFIDGSGVLLDLADGDRPRVVPIAFEPPPAAEPSPAPYAGLHQPVGFSRDGRWLYAARTIGEAPYAQLASRIDRTTGNVTAATETGAGGAALERSSHLIRTPEQVGPDGTIVIVARDLPGHAADFYRPGTASPERIAFEATGVNDVVWDGDDRVVALDMLLADPNAPVWKIDAAMGLIGIEPATGATTRLVDIDMGPYAPALVSCRAGFALVRWLPGPADRELEWVLVQLDGGEATGFRSSGWFAGWVTDP